MAVHIKTEAPDGFAVGASVIFLVAFSCIKAALYGVAPQHNAAQPDFREYKEATQAGDFLYGGP